MFLEKLILSTNKIQGSMKNKFKKYIMLRLPGSRNILWEINGNEVPAIVPSIRFKLYGFFRTKFLFITMHLVDLLHIIYR
jgi:hypothetical protein